MKWSHVLCLALGVWVGNTLAHTFFWHAQWYKGFAIGAIAAVIVLLLYSVLPKSLK